MLAVVAVSLLLVVPVDAQTSLDQAREDVAGATDRLEAFLEDLDTTQRRGNELAALFWQAQAGLEALDIEIVNNEAAAAELATQIADLRAEVKIIAVDQYMSRADDIDVGDHESESDRAAAEALARLVIGVDNTAIDQLAVIGAESDRLSASLAIQRSEQAARLAEVQSTQQSIADELERLARLRSAVAAELLDLEDALGELEQAESERQAAAAEQERIVEERRRAEAAAAAAAELARRVPTPAPTPVPTPAPTPDRRLCRRWFLIRSCLTRRRRLWRRWFPIRSCLTRRRRLWRRWFLIRSCLTRCRRLCRRWFPIRNHQRRSPQPEAASSAHLAGRLLTSMTSVRPAYTAVSTERMT